jgi:hypothetical protein
MQRLNCTEGAMNSKSLRQVSAFWDLCSREHAKELLEILNLREVSGY